MGSKCVNKIRFGFLERPLSNICYKHTLNVARHPWPYIIVPLLITGAFGVGYFFKIETHDSLSMYTPINALALVEQRTIKELFPHLDGFYTPVRSISTFDGECDVTVNTKKGDNILTPKYREAVKRLNDFITNNITATVDGLEYSYTDICMKFLHSCHKNSQIYVVDIMMSYPGPDDNLTYPTARYGNRRFYLGQTLGQVEVDPRSKQIVSAKAWLLIYQVRWVGQFEKISKAWQLALQRGILSYRDDDLEVNIFHSQSLDLEMARNSDTIMPKMILCIALLFTFANLCSLSVIWDHGWPYVDWTRSKPYVGTAGLLGAIMGVLTTIGLMAFCGAKYDSACDAMPFVVLGVRLDNTFLMISAIHHTKQTLPAHERVAEAMAEAAMSITITVLTDMLSFAVGIPTDFRAIQLFSIYTVLAMGITYVYQLTFLLAVLVLTVRNEGKNVHTLAPCKTTLTPTDSNLTMPKPSIWARMFCWGSHVTVVDSSISKENGCNNLTKDATRSDHSKVQYREGTWISRIIRTYYAPFLMKNYTRLAVAVLYAIYLGVSIYGCINVRQGLEPSRLLPDDSYAKTYQKRLEQYFWARGTQAHVTFSNAGDLTDKLNRDRIFAILDRFANSKHGMGREGVDFWLYEFQNFLKAFRQQSLDDIRRANFYETVDYFLTLEEYSQYRNDVHWTNSTVNSQSNITAFRALVGMVDFETALKQIETVDSFRAIASEYPYYNISTFEIAWLFVDQYEEVLPNTMQEIYGGIAFMILIAVFLIPSVMCTLWVVLAILSIDAGTIGLMTFWDINLDIISMICIIMSIGFSVDFTAHIAYSFVVIEGKDPVDKTHKALGTVAWPILQGAISTTMGVVALAGGGSYIQVAFFKTVFIVILLGLVHALVFLPVVLSVFSCKLSTKNVGQQLCCFRDKLFERNDNGKNNSNMEIATVTGKTVVRIDRNDSSHNTIPEDPNVS